ncbi:hypothetical protein FAUST_12073 [Fusarium austroamericanum]|uniref:Uncharacterized protein n=1 Tax=Fusarium austroamericanum TaxID=282268 RepID=A0AAN6BUK3_FUSAU|nr:hypothetical protein FAUST_12073 [Fusarium austroamericanum]
MRNGLQLPFRPLSSRPMDVESYIDGMHHTFTGEHGIKRIVHIEESTGDNYLEDVVSLRQLLPKERITYNMPTIEFAIACGMLLGGTGWYAHPSTTARFTYEIVAGVARGLYAKSHQPAPALRWIHSTTSHPYDPTGLHSQATNASSTLETTSAGTDLQGSKQVSRDTEVHDMVSLNTGHGHI